MPRARPALEVPLTRSLRSAFGRREPVVLIAWSVILLVYCLLASLPLSRTSQERAMRKLHLTSHGSGSWMAEQMLPSMYNFANRVTLRSTTGLVDPLNDDRWINHYPPRVVTFVERSRFLDSTLRPSLAALEATFRSDYRGARLTTVCQVSSRDLIVDSPDTEKEAHEGEKAAGVSFDACTSTFDVKSR